MEEPGEGDGGGEDEEPALFLPPPPLLFPFSESRPLFYSPLSFTRTLQ